MIECISDVVRLIHERGFLPFFADEVTDFSLEEQTPAELWFPDDSLQDMGVWDWKSDIILEADCAYAKLYKKKMCFVSMQLFPDLVNVRRHTRLLNAEEERLLTILREHQTLLTSEWKRLGGYSIPRHERSKNPLDAMLQKEEQKVRRKKKTKVQSFDSVLTQLQMSGHVVCAAFEYNYDHQGKRYGWGKARYVAAEDFFGTERLEVGRNVDESIERLRSHFRRLYPNITEKQLEHIIF